MSEDRVCIGVLRVEVFQGVGVIEISKPVPVVGESLTMDMCCMRFNRCYRREWYGMSGFVVRYNRASVMLFISAINSPSLVVDSLTITLFTPILRQASRILGSGGCP